MSILINENTRALVQGITGKEGLKAAREMRAYGTEVAAGVTPGKGGTTTEDGTPVYNTVVEALIAHPDINATLVAVPGKFVPAACEEAIHARIPLINILSERVPLYGLSRVLALASARSITIVGPSSVGIISPGKGKIGSIGSSGMALMVFTPGPVGVVSKSGGMTSELSRILSEAGIGQSTALGIGGDPIVGTNFLDAALLFERDPETRAMVIFGEVGGTYENQLADAVKNGTITKPVVALIAGVFAESLPQGTALGHAGAIIEGDRAKASVKIATLRDAGALVADTPEEVLAILKKIL